MVDHRPGAVTAVVVSSKEERRQRRPRRDTAIPKRKRGRPRKEFVILGGEIVGENDLGPNPLNPYDKLSPEERTRIFSQILQAIVTRQVRTLTSHMREAEAAPKLSSPDQAASTASR